MFVEACLNKEPKFRPSAKELLKHRFLRQSKKTSYLIELIDRHRQWKTQHNDSDSSGDSDSDTTGPTEDPPDWKFDDTVKFKNGLPKVFAKSRSLQELLTPVLKQLKENKFQDSENRSALDDMRAALEDAENSCSGVNDKLVDNLVERFRKYNVRRSPR